MQSCKGHKYYASRRMGQHRNCESRCRVSLRRRTPLLIFSRLCDKIIHHARALVGRLIWTTLENYLPTSRCVSKERAKFSMRAACPPNALGDAQRRRHPLCCRPKVLPRPQMPVCLLGRQRPATPKACYQQNGQRWVETALRTRTIQVGEMMSARSVQKTQKQAIEV